MDPVDAQKFGWFPVPPYDDQDPGSIEKDGEVRTPSDHCGLIADI